MAKRVSATIVACAGRKGLNLFYAYAISFNANKFTAPVSLYEIFIEMSILKLPVY